MTDSELPVATYPMSADYSVLVAWMRQKTIACVLDFEGRRIIAEASASRVGDGLIYCVTSAGRMLVSGTVEQFIERCEEVELEFIDPRLASEQPPFVTFLTWLGGITFAAACVVIVIWAYRSNS